MTKKRILVVEDDGITAKHIQSTLEDLGYCVLDVTAFAEEAVLKAVYLKPDLILMDIYLKGSMTGIEAAHLIKKRQDIPIVYLTASSDQESFKKAEATQSQGFVIKPFESNLLHSAIEKALHGQACQDEVDLPSGGL